ncbi:hypothetical protein WJX82_005133 [Trebouxia sp. C0006]
MTTGFSVRSLRSVFCCAVRVVIALAITVTTGTTGAGVDAALLRVDGDLNESQDYGEVLASSRSQSIDFWDLPGFTRSHYAADHALVTPESRVFAGMPGWTNALTAHLVSRAKGANFVMFLADMQANSSATSPAAGTERLIFILDGVLELSYDKHSIALHSDDFAYLPAHVPHSLQSSLGAGMLIFERAYGIQGGKAEVVVGSTSKQPVLDVSPEIFTLRKLLPQTGNYDFNVHIMDFRPGEYLYVKEVHYNQHGLLLLQGQGIYRLADQWYPVQAGDAIWMAPYVVQWYAALGQKSSRYILYKDTTLDPLVAT